MSIEQNLIEFMTECYSEFDRGTIQILIFMEVGAANGKICQKEIVKKHNFPQSLAARNIKSLTSYYNEVRGVEEGLGLICLTTKKNNAKVKMLNLTTDGEKLYARLKNVFKKTNHPEP